MFVNKIFYLCFLSIALTENIQIEYTIFAMSRKEQGQKPKNIRDINRNIILDIYRNNITVSAALLAQSINLSKTTVMKINKELVDKKIIKKVGKGKSTDEGGKKPVLYSLIENSKLILSFHIHYTKIEFRLFNLRCKCILNDETPILKNESFPSIVSAMKNILDRQNLLHNSTNSYLACMVAIHGDTDSETGRCIHSTYFPSWEREPNLTHTIQKICKLSCPLYIDNWIRMRAYGENRLGKAQGRKSVVLIDAGQHGVTSGILIDGKVFKGRHSLAGEIGHICMDVHSSIPCACGNTGCFESLVSYERLLSRTEKEDGKKFTTLSELFSAADSGDRAAKKALDTVSPWFALAISTFILFFDPEMILIEGDFAAGCNYFETSIKRQIKRFILPRVNWKTDLIFNNRQSVDTLIGAAILAMDLFFKV